MGFSLLDNTNHSEETGPSLSLKASLSSPHNVSVAPTVSTHGDYSWHEDEAAQTPLEHRVPLTIQTTAPHAAFGSSQGTEITMAQPRQLDKYGFIVNMDSSGHMYDSSYPRATERLPTQAETKRTERREKKWDVTLSAWDKRRSSKIKKRLRKGVPDSMRGNVWLALGGGVRRKGLYQSIVNKTTDAMLKNCKEQVEAMDPTLPGSRASSPTSQSSDYAYTPAFRAVQDTIERDIHRTFPRHNLFYERDEEKAGDDAIITAASALWGLPIQDPELAGLILNLEADLKVTNRRSPTNSQMSVHVPPGQAALRRVLRAYSYYDREISYCQGMNFVVGMFLTFMTEEEAFWVLVATMNNKPCQMRGLFAEGMKETHMVLHVAEQLIHHHLPRLARHFDEENIHVTMYATQWLLTQYTSSFKFDLVTRVWDCFLGEGWKIIYRVMLALLQQWQSQLLKMPFEEILNFFRELPERVDGQAVMDVAMRIPLKTAHIQKYEKEWHARQQNGSSSR
eukprot:Nitzschia sp. Nitz4//scaffold11_size288233//74300//75905//NITZ4_000749-RA/size288233-snap-gene-0.14-mRNA-1//1//CDS//3329533999//1508//frame0